MSESNAQLIHSLCTEQADAFAQADDLLPERYHNNHHRILAACMIAHALDLNPAAVMFGLHMETAPAATQKTAEPKKAEKPQKPAGDATWPRKINGEWTASDNVVYDKALHGFNKTAKMPSVKADGTFRNARHANKSIKETQAMPASAGDEQGETHSGDDEQAMIDANQVLASFKNHITSASTVERLEQLSTQIELMGFTPSELTVARRWIAERAEAIE